MLFVRPIAALSKMLHYFVDIWALDGLVEGAASGVRALGAQFRKLQNGNIEYYLLGMVLGLVALLVSVFV